MASFTEKRAKLNFKEHKEGDPITVSWIFDFDLTGYHSWSADVKAAPNPNAPVLASFQVDDSLQADPDRKITMRLSGMDVTMLLDGAGYDAQVLDAGGEPHTFAEGTFEIIPQYTV